MDKVGKVGEQRANPWFTERICPRCGVNPLPFGYPGALSRADNRTEICSPCGQTEAMEDFTGGPLGAKANPSTDWPVR